MFEQKIHARKKDRVAVGRIDQGEIGQIVGRGCVECESLLEIGAGLRHN